MVLEFAREERRTTERGMRETARALALAMDREVGEVQATLGILRIRSTGWTVALLAPAAVVDAPRRQSLWLVVGGGLALSTLAMGLAVGLSRRIARPIKGLVAATQALSQGLPVAIDTSCAVQEVQEVSAALHNMVVLLQQRDAAFPPHAWHRSSSPCTPRSPRGQGWACTLCRKL
jgi:sensor histidine kinase YesM